MKVIYVAGPYRGPNAWAIEENIRRAERLAFTVWAMGAAAICPHSNTRYFDGALPDSYFLNGDLAILEKCDGIILTPDYQLSTGAMAELESARQKGIPVFYDSSSLKRWLNASVS